MAATTFLLLQADPGYAHAVARGAASMPGVAAVSVTSGPYDVIAELTADAEPAIQQVLTATRRLPGLARLCVCRPSWRVTRSCA